MILAPSVSGLFKWRQFEPEFVLLAIGGHLRFSLSYRDVEELLAERGFWVDHVTVWRWVQSYAPELERVLRRRLGGPLQTADNPPKNSTHSYMNMQTYIQYPNMTVPLVRCSALPMFEGHPLIVTAQLEAFQVELTVL